MSPTPTFAVAVTCIDGRIQSAVGEGVRSTHGVDHVDVVTVPGVDGVLATGEGPARQQVVDAVRVSVVAHGSRVAVVAGHTDCAGHPVDDDAHARDVATTVAWLQGEFPDLQVLGAVVDTATGELRSA